MQHRGHECKCGSGIEHDFHNELQALSGINGDDNAREQGEREQTGDIGKEKSLAVAVL